MNQCPAGLTRVSDAESLLRESTVLTSYQDVEEVLRRSRDFTGQGSRGPDAVEFLEGTLTELDGEAHSTMRRLMAKAMSPAQLKLYEDLMVATIEDHLRSAGRANSKQAVALDLLALSREIFWQLGIAMAGLDGVEDAAGLHHLQDLVVRVGAGGQVMFTEQDQDEVVLAAREATQQFEREFYIPSRDRRQALLDKVASGEMGRTSLPSDVLTLLLGATPSVPDDVIMRQCALIAVSSVSSTINVICHAVAELDEWLVAHPDEVQIALNDDFIARVVNETIRLHRTGQPYLLRYALQDVVLASGRSVPAGTVVAMDLRQANKDPEAFGADAATFNPHRYTASARIKGYGLGFGSGPHVCLAKRMVVADEADVSASRLLDVVLRKLLVAGVRRDPEYPAVAEAHGADRFVTFPVLVGRGEDVSNRDDLT